MKNYNRLSISFFILWICLNSHAQKNLEYDTLLPRLTLESSAPTGLFSQYSPKGKYVFAYGGGTAVNLFDPFSGKLIHSIKGNNMMPRSVAFSSDGKFLMTTSLDGSAKLWNIKTGDLLYNHKKLMHMPIVIAFNPKGDEYLVTWINMMNGSIKNEVRNSKNGKIKFKFSTKGKFYIRKSLLISGVNPYENPFSHDGKILCVVGNQPKKGKSFMNLIEVGSGKTAQKIECPSTIILTKNHPSKHEILTTNADSTLNIWQSETGLRSLRVTNDASIDNAFYNHDGSLIITFDKKKNIKTWDAQTGDLITEITNDAKSKKVKICQSNNYLLTLDQDNKVKIWDAYSGTQLLILKNKGRISDASFSPDGKQIFTCGSPSRLWNTKTGEITYEFGAKTNNIYDFKINPFNNEVLIYNFDKNRDDYNVKILSKDLQKEIYDLSQERRYSDYNVNQNQILTRNEDGTIKTWDWNTGTKKLEITFDSDSIHFPDRNSTAFSHEGKEIIGIDTFGMIQKWDSKTGHLIMQFKIPNWEWDENETFTQFSLDLSLAMSIIKDEVNVFNLDTKKTQCTLKIPTELSKNWPYATYEGKFSPNNKLLITYRSNERKPLVWNALSGELLYELKGHSEGVTDISFIKEGTQIITTSFDKTIKIWDSDDGTLIHNFEAHESLILQTSFNPKNDWLASSSLDGTIRLWDVNSGNLIKTMKGVNVIMGYSILLFHPNGKFICLTQANGSVGYWDINTGKKVMDYYFFTGSNYAVVHPSGLFDASPEAMKWMYYVVGDEVIELEQLKNRFYEPGLIDKLLAYEHVRDVKSFEKVALYPAIQSQIENDELHIQLQERNGGIGKVSLFVNNKEVMPDANANRDTSLTIDLTQFQKYYFQDTINSISFRAYNSDGWLKSSAIHHSYQPDFPDEMEDEESGTISLRKAHEPNLYAVIVGTSDYVGEDLDLQFADKDSKDIAYAIEQSGALLFGVEKVHVNWFTSTDLPGSQLASKKNIQEAFDSIATSANPEDILLVYFSGHGVNYGSTENEQFYYLTKDFHSGDLSDPEIRNNYAISTEEMTQWITNNAAQKQVMILDACSSGQVVEDLLAVRNVPSSQIRALDRMKDRTGMFVLAGSAADKVSYEASQFGQGLLTYSLLLGMDGAALRDGQSVDVMNLFQFARDQVPEFANEIGGVQTPTLAVPTDASSFDIGLVTDEIEITLKQIKPLFVRSNFQDEDRIRDVMQLSKALDEHLLDSTSGASSKGIVFVDVIQFKNAYSINGRYKIEGESINANVNVFKGDDKIGEFAASGSKNEMDQMVEKILEGVVTIVNE